MGNHGEEDVTRHKYRKYMHRKILKYFQNMQNC